MWTITVRDAQGTARASGTVDAVPVTLGRTPDNDVVVDDPAVSRQHARFERRGAQLWVEDLGSSNGVSVNGTLIKSACAIDDRSRVEIGYLHIEICEGQPGGEVIGDQTVETDALGNVIPSSSRPAPSPAPPPAPPPAAPEPEPAPAPAASPAAATASDSVAHSELQRKMQMIREHREAQRNTQQSRREAFDQQWNALLNEMRTLRDQLNGNPRVLYFTISRDERQISIKLDQPGARPPQRFLLMSRGHPDRVVGGDERVYLREQGVPQDTTYTTPKDALADFVNRVASILA